MSLREPLADELSRMPRGFRVAGVRCGIKHDANALDLALIHGSDDLVAAGVYTQNRIVAAPVVWDRRLTPSTRIRAVVINSGNANACTGPRGAEDVQATARLVGQTLQVDEEQVLVMSTGIIGEYLPMDRLLEGIPAAAGELADSPTALLAAARAIMTTDRVPKLAQRSINLSGNSIRITGVAKGAGMIGPRMATMLAVIMTDATIPSSDAQALLDRIAERTFNCISVEGHTSTNDTVLLLSSGAAGPVAAADISQLEAAFTDVARELARQIPSDGEGATHLITVRVRGATDDLAARRVARTVADSPLVKTAVTGADPNWGRIVSAAGYAGVSFKPDDLRLAINGTEVFAAGMPTQFDSQDLSRSMREQFEVTMELDLGAGAGQCEFWTSDLTHEYITINAEYHT